MSLRKIPPTQHELFKEIFQEASEKYDVPVEYIEDIWRSIWKIAFYLATETKLYPSVMLHYFGKFRVPIGKAFNHLKYTRLRELTGLSAPGVTAAIVSRWWPVLKRLARENKLKKHEYLARRIKEAESYAGLFDSFLTEEEVERFREKHR